MIKTWDCDSSAGIVTRYGAGRSGDRIPLGAGIFRTHPERLWGPPNLLYDVYRILPEDKEVRAWRCPPAISIIKVKERVGL